MLWRGSLPGEMRPNRFFCICRSKRFIIRFSRPRATRAKEKGLEPLAWLIFGIGIVSTLNLILGFVIATAFLTKILISYLGGRLIMERVKPDWSLSIYWSFVLGLIIFIALTAIPYIGWIVNLAVIFFGLGALLLLVKDRFWKSSETNVEKPSE